MSTGSDEKEKRKVNVYIDGFNLYHAMAAQNDNRIKWLNLRELGKSFLRPGEILNRVVFFTAILTWEKEKQQRHKQYVAALRAVGVDVVESNFRKIQRHCKIMDRYCARHEEKQTDVAIAVTALSDAFRGEFDRMVLITADSDQIPLVREIRRQFPEKTITLAAPPERGGEARELGQLVHDRKPITVERLLACRLPRDVFDKFEKKVATMPALYASKGGV